MPSANEILSAMDPDAARRLVALARDRAGISGVRGAGGVAGVAGVAGVGGVGGVAACPCSGGVGSWLSQFVRAAGGVVTAAVSTVNPTAGNALGTALGLFYQPAPPAQSTAAQAPAKDNTILIVGGLALAFLLLKGRR